MMKFKTNAKCGGCVTAIGNKLNEVIDSSEWSIDLASPDRILTVTADIPSARVVQAVESAGFKADFIA